MAVIAIGAGAIIEHIGDIHNMAIGLGAGGDNGFYLGVEILNSFTIGLVNPPQDDLRLALVELFFRRRLGVVAIALNGLQQGQQFDPQLIREQAGSGQADDETDHGQLQQSERWQA